MFEIRGLCFAVNSFPEFENEKDFEIKLSLSLTSFFRRFLSVLADHCVDLFSFLMNELCKCTTLSEPPCEQNLLLSFSLLRKGGSA